MSNDIYSYIEENFNIKITDYQFKRDYIKKPLKRGKNQHDTEHFDKDDLYYLYITLNIRLQDLTKMFNMKLRSIRRELLFHKIKKSPTIWSKNKEETNIKKYGVKAPSQCPEILQKQIDKCMKKYNSRSSLWGNNSYKLSERSNNKSKGENKWLLSLNIPIDKEHRQVKIYPYVVDGFDPKTNTVYEYLGDYWHGNLSIYKETDFNKSVKKSFKELNEKTFNRLNNIKNKGYKVIYIWESEFKKGMPYNIL